MYEYSEFSLNINMINSLNYFKGIYKFYTMILYIIEYLVVDQSPIILYTSNREN